MTAPEFRRIRTSEIWHWCSNCSRWPSRDFETRMQLPQHAARCAECQAKTENGKCDA